VEPQKLSSEVRGYIEKTDAWCPCCGYKLRGIAADRCPECGKELVLDELIRSRYTPRLHVATGFGFLVSSIMLSATIVLIPLGMVCFGVCIWWAAAQDRFGQMDLATRKRILYLSWSPVFVVAILVAAALVFL